MKRIHRRRRKNNVPQTSVAAQKLIDQHNLNVLEIPRNKAGKIGKPEVIKYLKSIPQGSDEEE